MGKTYLKRLTTLIISFGIIMSLLTIVDINKLHAEDEVANQKYNQPMQNDYYTVIDENGNVIFKKYNDRDNEMKTLKSNDYNVVKNDGKEKKIVETFDTYEEAKEVVDSMTNTRFRSATTFTYDIEAIADTKAIKYGVATLKGYVKYREVESNGTQGKENYTQGTAANDAAYISTSSDGKTVRVKQSGIVMDVPASKVSVSEYNSKSKVSYYQGKDGKFYHYYLHGDGKFASTQVGYTPSELKDNTKYYSYDGHYFYTSYTQMLDDYKSGYDYYTHSVNANKPFYNYYQYLSFRSSTKFSASDFNRLVEDTKGKDTKSKIKDQGQAFINSQNLRGTNASLMFGVAINESAWGLSKYAQDRNNLFGLGAVDSDPDKALRFNTVEDCLVYFSYNTISSGYLDGGNWRYRGPHLGDKRSGVNVKYASDPFWGEKAASFSYILNSRTGNKDYQNYQISISKKTKQNLYSTSALNKKIYDSSVANKYEDLYCYPLTILSQERNSYKVLSDTVLNSSRTSKNPTGHFDITRDYVYVPINDVNIVGDDFHSYLRGDVNGDGRVSTLDYIAIENHIMNRNKLTGDKIIRADVNGDGRVSTLDYIAIENHIMGRKPLF